MNGDDDQAAIEYRRFLSCQSEQKVDQTAFIRGLKGRAHYRLAEYRDAIANLSEALSMEARQIGRRFDIGLVFLCANQAQLATDAYERALEEASHLSRRRRHGILFVAQFDLKDARARYDVDHGTTAKIAEMIGEALRGVLLVLEGHKSPVYGVAFSPDGYQLASASDDGTVRLWDPETGQPTVTLERPGRVRGVAFSPDGRQLASAGEDGAVRLWDPVTGQLTATLQGHTGPVNGVAFSPDGRQLASASNDGTVRLWDPAGKQLTATLEGHKDRVQAVAFSRDGRQLASASSDRTVRLWDPASRQLTATLEGHTGFVNGVAFSPDGRQLASVGDDGTVRLWDFTTGQSSTLRGYTGPLLAMTFSPDGRQLATGGDDRTVRLWNVAPTSDLPV